MSCLRPDMKVKKSWPHGADLHWSCAEVLRVSHRNLCRRKRKVRCAACRHREKSSTISRVIDANFGKILRMFDVGRVRFRHCTSQRLDADILRRQNVFAATPAEVLVRCASTAQRICNGFAHFLSENLRNRAAERAIFSARIEHGADLHWSCADVLQVSHRNLCRRKRKV